jgi:vacuolar-type H+-ATPase subunit I/STV1
MTNEDFIQRITVTEQRLNDHETRIDKLEKDQKAIQSLATSVAVMASEQKRMGEDINKTTETLNAIKETMEKFPDLQRIEKTEKDLETLKMKPAKRWESIVEKVLLVVVGGLVAYVMTRIGIG